jgi:hypothetical protein
MAPEPQMPINSPAPATITGVAPLTSACPTLPGLTVLGTVLAGVVLVIWPNPEFLNSESLPAQSYISLPESLSFLRFARP